MVSIWVPDAAPASAGSLDDEFDGVSGGVPPGWTEVDFGNRATVSEDEAGLVITCPAFGASSEWFGIYQAIPAGNFTMWAKCSLSGLLSSSKCVGIALWQDATSSSGDLLNFYVRINSTDTHILTSSHTSYTDAGTILSTKTAQPDIGSTDCYLRIRRNGTTYYFDYSTDGIGWIRLDNRTLSFTPTHIGPTMSNDSANAGTVVGRWQFFRSLGADVGIDGLVEGARPNVARGTSAWVSETPPVSAGAQDDEFADNSGGVPGGWTEVDFAATLTATEDKAGLKLFCATHSGNQISGLYKTIPGGDFTIVTKYSASEYFGTTIFGGLALWVDATDITKGVVTFGLWQDTADSEIAVHSWTAYNSALSTLTAVVLSADIDVTGFWLRIRRTGTTYAFDMSLDGEAWLRIRTGTLSITPTHYGPYLNNANTGGDASARFALFRYLASDVGFPADVSGDVLTLIPA